MVSSFLVSIAERSTDLLRIGTGGESIYGEKFEDEAFPDNLKHTRPFLLSMVCRSLFHSISSFSHTRLRTG